MKHALTRRDLIRGVAFGGIGAAIGVSCASCRGNQQASEAPGAAARPTKPDARARVVVVRREDALDDQGRTRLATVREMLEEAMAKLDGEDGDPARAWASRFTAEDKVGLKGNVMMNHVRPEILLAIHDSLTEHARVASEEILAWDRAQGARGRAQLARPDREWTGDPVLSFDADSVSRVCSEWATALVNVPSLKCHWLSGVAIALKNWCGAVTNISVGDGEGTAFRFHGDSCADLGLFEAMPSMGGKCRLIVVDAMEPYYEKGPQVDPEYFHAYGGLIVGVDPVAVDTVGTMLLQAIRDEAAGAPSPISPPPKHVGIAETRYGLGVSDPARIDIVRLGDTEGMLV